MDLCDLKVGDKVLYEEGYSNWNTGRRMYLDEVSRVTKTQISLKDRPGSKFSSRNGRRVGDKWHPASIQVYVEAVWEAAHRRQREGDMRYALQHYDFGKCRFEIVEAVCSLISEMKPENKSNEGTEGSSKGDEAR